MLSLLALDALGRRELHYKPRQEAVQRREGRMLDLVLLAQAKHRSGGLTVSSRTPPGSCLVLAPFAAGSFLPCPLSFGLA